MTFLFIYVYLKCTYVNWDCVQLKGESDMRRSHFFTQREKLGFVQASIFNYTFMYTISIREYSDYITEPCLYKVSLYFTSE